MAAIYLNGWNILSFNFTKRDALSSVCIRYHRCRVQIKFLVTCITGASSEYNFTQRCLANPTGLWREVFCGVYMRGGMPSRHDFSRTNQMSPFSRYRFHDV
jgi:hypothetical protein